MTKHFLFQFLWDMQSSAIYEAMGTDIAVWQMMLVDVRKRRQTFDTSEFMFKTGPVTVEFGKVQSKVNLKYDAWHKEMLVSFGQMMSDQMTTFHAEISRARTDLENSSVESAHTADAVQVITQVQKLKRQMKNWGPSIPTLNPTLVFDFRSVLKVIHPGLKSHPQHELAMKQMKGFSGMIAFYIRGGMDQSSKFLSALKVFTLAGKAWLRNLTHCLGEHEHF